MTEPAAATPAAAIPAANPTGSGLANALERVTSVFTPEENVAESLKTAKALAESRGSTGAGDPAKDGAGKATGGKADDSNSEPKEPEDPKEEKEPKDPKAAKPPASIDDLKGLAKAGKLDEVLKTLGVDPEGLQIPSERFAKFRKMQTEATRKLEQRRTEIDAKEAAVQQTVADVRKEYEPLAKAKQAYESGDVLGALSLAFGDKFDRVIELAIAQQAGKDPELIALKKREEKREQADRERREAEQRRAAEEQRAAAEADYVKRLGSELVASTDPIIAKAAKEADFVHAVFRAQMLRYDNGRGVELTPDEAAGEVIETIRKAHLRWSDVFGPTGGGESSESTAGAGTSPQITTRAGRSPEPKGARKGVSVPRAAVTPTKDPKDMSDEELIKHFGSLMDQDD